MVLTDFRLPNEDGLKLVARAKSLSWEELRTLSVPLAVPPPASRIARLIPSRLSIAVAPV